MDAADVKAAINMSLGTSRCTANIASANVCNVLVVQRVINASPGAVCATSLGVHVVSSNLGTQRSNVTAYKVYRGASSTEPYTLLQVVRVGTTYTDNTSSLAGHTYVVTAVNSSNKESDYSNTAQAIIPIP